MTHLIAERTFGSHNALSIASKGVIVKLQQREMKAGVSSAQIHQQSHSPS
jgi:hypothetical protein